MREMPLSNASSNDLVEDAMTSVTFAMLKLFSFVLKHWFVKTRGRSMD